MVVIICKYVLNLNSRWKYFMNQKTIMQAKKTLFVSNKRQNG